MNRSLIVAMARNGVIGVDNKLPWKLSADLARFKRLTMGHHIIMGRKTFESIGRALPGRTTVVLTRSEFVASGVIVAPSLDEAYEVARDDDEPFVCGGAEVYKLALPTVDRVYLTVVERDFEGDAFFAPLDPAQWVVRESERHSDGELPFRFETWNRRRP
jgi:dihydrofolate reductase